MRSEGFCRRIIVAVVPLAALAIGAQSAEFERTLDPHRYHLGTPGQPEWQESVGKTPHGRRLDIRFSGQTNSQEATLFIRQDDVKLEWGIELNGRKIGNLFLMEAPLVFALP